MKIEILTTLRSWEIEEVIEVQNNNLYNKQIKPTLAALKNDPKLSIDRKLAAAALRKMIPKETQEFMINAFEELMKKKEGLQLIAYVSGGLQQPNTAILYYPDFFYDLLYKSETSSIPAQIWEKLKKAGMLQKSRDDELKEIVKDFKAIEGKWIEKEVNA